MKAVPQRAGRLLAAWAAAGLAALGSGPPAAAQPAGPEGRAEPADREAGAWNFTAMLDGSPIGMHRFVVSGPASERRVSSRAQFTVRWLGITVYRYRHEADERWQGDCLRELRAETDDDGPRPPVAQRFDGGCLMSFAYWNPRLVQQAQLVDPQTGRVEAARFERVADEDVDVDGRPVRAQGWRLATGRQRITVWYAANGGRWIGLDADAPGGRRLRYRLLPERP